MALVVYADFSSPECYLASRRVDGLRAAGVEVDWRAVELDVRLPVTGRPLGPDARAELADRMAGVAALLLPGEAMPWTPPGRLPNTRAAVSGYAEAWGAGIADDVRRLLFTAYWVDGADIGSPEVLRPRLAGPVLRGRSPSWPLRESGHAVTASRGPVTTDAWRRVRAWREEWRRIGLGSVPILLEEDCGSPVSGQTALRRLEKEMLRADAPPDPTLPDPARYPQVAVRPPREWVSQVGGRWAHAWRSGRVAA